MRNVFQCKGHKFNAPSPCARRTSNRARERVIEKKTRKSGDRERKVCQEGGRGNKQRQVQGRYIEGGDLGNETERRTGQSWGVSGVIKTRRCALASGSSYLLHF